MMMMMRMKMKRRMMITKAGFFQNFLNAQSSLCRNGGHSVITQLVAFISNKMRYIFFFFSTEDEKMEIIDHTETNLVALRRTIYLTIQSRYCMSQNLIPI